MFPLNTVLFPGVTTPLHVFEDRYRALVHHLLTEDDPTQRLFGVTAIREGYEVGDHGVQSLHTTGTVMQLTEVEQYPTAASTSRWSAGSGCGCTTSTRRGPTWSAWSTPSRSRTNRGGGRGRTDPGHVRRPTGDESASSAAGPCCPLALPRDPTYLSWSLATACLLTMPERQSLLEAPDTATRLVLLRRSLVNELRAMKAVPSLPATEVARTRWNPN